MAGSGVVTPNSLRQGLDPLAMPLTGLVALLGFGVALGNSTQAQQGASSRLGEIARSHRDRS